MSLFTDDYLNHLLKRGEIELSARVPCIFYRFSLAVTAGTSVYDLPSGVTNILRVTWKGDRVSPLEHSDTRDTNWMKPQNLSAQGKPKFYISKQYGYGKIKFHPVPHESVTADDTNIYGSDIENRVIVSAFRLADPDGSDYRIPEAIRQRFGKYYVLFRAYQREGKGQNLEAAQYYRNKYEIAVKEFKRVVSKIPSSIVVQLGPTGTSGERGKVPRPTLPSDGVWGW